MDKLLITSPFGYQIYAVSDAKIIVEKQAKGVIVLRSKKAINWMINDGTFLAVDGTVRACGQAKVPTGTNAVSFGRYSPDISTPENVARYLLAYHRLYVPCRSKGLTIQTYQWAIGADGEPAVLHLPEGDITAPSEKERYTALCGPKAYMEFNGQRYLMANRTMTGYITDLDCDP